MIEHVQLGEIVHLVCPFVCVLLALGCADNYIQLCVVLTSDTESIQESTQFLAFLIDALTYWQRKKNYIDRIWLVLDKFSRSGGGNS